MVLLFLAFSYMTFMQKCWGVEFDDLCFLFALLMLQGLLHVDVWQ
jgi:hypothetical protein